MHVGTNQVRLGKTGYLDSRQHKYNKPFPCEQALDPTKPSHNADASMEGGDACVSSHCGCDLGFSLREGTGNVNVDGFSELLSRLNHDA